jgi:hypothetical protein
VTITPRPMARSRPTPVRRSPYQSADERVVRASQPMPASVISVHRAAWIRLPVVGDQPINVAVPRPMPLAVPSAIEKMIMLARARPSVSFQVGWPVMCTIVLYGRIGGSWGRGWHGAVGSGGLCAGNQSPAVVWVPLCRDLGVAGDGQSHPRPRTDPQTPPLSLARIPGGLGLGRALIWFLPTAKPSATHLPHGDAASKSTEAWLPSLPYPAEADLSELRIAIASTSSDKSAGRNHRVHPSRRRLVRSQLRYRATQF